MTRRLAGVKSGGVNLGDTGLDSPGVVHALDHLAERYADLLTLPRAQALIRAEVESFRGARIQAFVPVLIEHSLREESRRSA